MGKINAGLHGKIKNKVGGVVYRILHGVNTVSEYQPEIHDLKSEAQLIQRLKFKNLTKFLKWFGSEFLLLAFLFAGNKLSGFANAIKKNMQAMNDDGTIDSTKLKLTANNDPFKPTVIATYNRFLDRCEVTVTNQNIFINKATGAVSFIINSFRPGQSTNINDDEWVDFFYSEEWGKWVCAWETGVQYEERGFWNDLETGFMEPIEYWGQWDEGTISNPNYDTYPLVKWANSVIITDKQPRQPDYPKPVKLFVKQAMGIH
jgi:hypothetical protein